MKKYVQLVCMICISIVFLKCEKDTEQKPEGETSSPIFNLTDECVLYENNEFNNLNPKAIYSEVNREIYIVFTCVPPTLDSTAIMFTVLSESGEVIQSPIQIESVKSISSFPNITQSNGRIFVTWHGNKINSTSEGLSIVELSREGIIQRRYISDTEPQVSLRGDALLVNQTSLFHFYNTELDEDITHIVYIRASIKDGLESEDSAIIGNGSIHHAYWNNGSIKVVYNQNGKLTTATFDQQSGSFNNIVNLESLDHFDPVISFSPLPDGETVAAFSKISENLSLQFYSSDGNKTKTVNIKSEAYNFSNIAVKDSIISIAWVTGENNVEFTLYSLLSSQLYEIKQMNNSTTGLAIEPLLLSVPSGIFTFWRDTRNHNGGDIYYRRTNKL